MNADALWFNCWQSLVNAIKAIWAFVRRRFELPNYYLCGFILILLIIRRIVRSHNKFPVQTSHLNKSSECRGQNVRAAALLSVHTPTTTKLKLKLKLWLGLRHRLTVDGHDNDTATDGRAHPQRMSESLVLLNVLKHE